jgi:phage terminase small subunit
MSKKPLPKNAGAKRLTPKQKRFVDEYMIDLNATQAAIRSGCSVRSAKEIGHEYLTKPHIAEALAKRVERLRVKTELTAEWVLNEFRKIIVAEDARYADKISALNSVARHLGMFKDKLELQADLKHEITFRVVT